MELHSPMYEHAMARVLEDLTERFSDGFTAAEVAGVVARGRTRLETSGRPATFAPALLDHWARDELLSLARAEGRALSPLPKVLFVCERGEGRSQVAAALAEHLSGGRVLARSAGIRPTGRLNPHAPTVLAERGIELRNPLPGEVQEDVLDAADVLVLIGVRDCDLLGVRSVRWDVDDPYAQDLPTARRIAEELETRVRELLAELEVPVEEQGTGPDSEKGRRQPAHAAAS
ncbi:low molecular weight phosphatase family protein [Ornithinimicrobium sufpigmenti]|uniref:arsenate-mycothiol transferase ArsC n=1 Tax=Ornithinimicrobium sufpigmenti TaxID=2508882 RepID=UPI00103681EF|nr:MULTISPECIES: arsenate reductase ArsC [unclassified Ornithinimicrobium]